MSKTRLRFRAFPASGDALELVRDSQQEMALIGEFYDKASSKLARLAKALDLQTRWPDHLPTRWLVDWSGSSRPADVAQLVLTIGFAAHAYVSGGVCLHGCAIAAGDHAAMFVGDSGAGKSSLTAALIAAGGRLLSEEIVIPAADPLQLRSGPEGVKISPAFAQRFGLQGNIRPAFEHPLLLDEGVVWTPPATDHPRADATLRQVYILEPRNQDKALQLSPRLSFDQAAPLLARSGYWYRVLAADLHRRLAEWGFRVATRCQVHRLSLPDDLALLPHCAADLIARIKAAAD